MKICLENWKVVNLIGRMPGIYLCHFHIDTMKKNKICFYIIDDTSPNNGDLVRLWPQSVSSVIRASKIVPGSVWCTRYELFALPTTSVSLLSGEGESEMERERVKALKASEASTRQTTR